MKRRAIAAMLALAACKKTPDPAPAPMSGASSEPSVVRAPAQPPSCSEPTASLAFADVGTIGVAALTNGTIWLTATRATKPPVHGVYRGDADLTKSTFLELGPAQGDEPPPEITTSGSDAVIATYAGKKPRTVALFRVGGAGAAVPLETFPVDEDESYSLALATREGRTVVVWDGELEKRGVIYARSGGVSAVVSQAQENASSPSIVATSRGFFVAWIAERPVSAGIADGGASWLEGPGEAPMYRGLQGIHLDAKGAPQGSVVHFGAAEGQILSFELGTSGDDVIALAVDRRVRANTASTRLLRFTLAATRPGAPGGAAGREGAPTEEEWIKSNVGNAGVSLFPSFAFVVDDRERAMFVANGKTRSEPRLDGAIPLVAQGENLFFARNRARDGGPGSELWIERQTCRVAF